MVECYKVVTRTIFHKCFGNKEFLNLTKIYIHNISINTRYLSFVLVFIKDTTLHYKTYIISIAMYNFYKALFFGYNDDEKDLAKRTFHFPIRFVVLYLGYIIEEYK